MSINGGAVLQFSLLAHTVPVSVELNRDAVEMKVREERQEFGRAPYIFRPVASFRTANRAHCEYSQ